jgi:predicted AAA+ superfamily ATPase
LDNAKYAIASYILHMWISRDVEGRLKRSAKTRPVIVLTGARQTGKTSTFRHLFPDYAFVSLDLPTEAEQAEKEPARFLQRNQPPVIIDEVQYAPGLFATSRWPSMHTAGATASSCLPVRRSSP